MSHVSTFAKFSAVTVVAFVAGFLIAAVLWSQRARSMVVDEQQRQAEAGKQFAQQVFQALPEACRVYLAPPQ